MSGVVLLFKISEDLIASKPFKTSRKVPYFEQNQFYAFLIYVFIRTVYPTLRLLYNISYQAVFINKKIYTSSRFVSLRAIFLDTSCF